METVQLVWVVILQVLAMLASVGALVLVLAAECWAAKNLVQGWRHAPGWRGFLNAASDMTHPTGIDEQLAEHGARRT